MKSVFIFILLVCFFQGRATAQETDNITHDNIVIPDTIIIAPDSIDIKLIGNAIDTSAVKIKPAFKPNPKKAILYSALVPGLGQIYNRKYWKLPLVYGGFLGCVYAITWNGNQYNGYKNAYSDWVKGDGSSWSNYVPYSWNINPNRWTDQQKERFATMLKNKKDYYRHYRDMSYIVTAGVYALWIIDAYVDAQLFDFDISPDLSMRVTPALFEMSTVNNSRTVGLQCSFKF